MQFTVTAERTPDHKWWILEETTLGAVSQVSDLASATNEMREALAFLAGISEDAVEINLIPILNNNTGEH